MKPCWSGFLPCATNLGRCIPKRYACDGREDCPDGSDESFAVCGVVDPCAGKLRCEDKRCMDPSLCCDPKMDRNCTMVPPCCVTWIESHRRALRKSHGLSSDNGDNNLSTDMHFLQSTIKTLIGTKRRCTFRHVTRGWRKLVYSVQIIDFYSILPWHDNQAQSTLLNYFQHSKAFDILAFHHAENCIELNKKFPFSQVAP